MKRVQVGDEKSLDWGREWFWLRMRRV